ncbi:MAG TPA: sodium:solute symporter [Planctomycetaceae bacterium]|nr:sodium:solute symporter [Planctomycetaceae bacterium]
MSLSIHPIDLAVLAAYLAAVIAVGLWVGRRGGRGLSEYLLGGRDLPWWALLGSIVATETSTATFLSVPGVAYAQGGDLRFLQLAIGYIVGRCLVTLILLPQYFRGELFTAYEVLHKRFGGTTKQAASLVFLVTRNLGDGLRLFLTAIALREVVGLPLSLCVIVIGAATIVYTVAGGMKSVVWNDCLQLVVYMAGGVAALLILLERLPGGWSGLTAFAGEHGKFRLFDFQFDLAEKYTFWAGLVGGAFLTMGTHGADQLMVQRYLSARSQRDAGRALVLSGLVVLVQFALFLLIGVGLAAFYAAFPPDQPFAQNDRVFASFVVNQLPVGLVGLALAAVFAAAMSTLSSSLNSSASAVVNDFLRSGAREDADSPRLVWVSRGLTLVFGAVQIAIGIAAARFATSVVEDALAVAGFSAGILLGVFALGVLTSRVGEKAALAGMLAGLAAVTFVKFATATAWPWFAMVGALTTFGAGLLASLVLPRHR